MAIVRKTQALSSFACSSRNASAAAAESLVATTDALVAFVVDRHRPRKAHDECRKRPNPPDPTSYAAIAIYHLDLQTHQVSKLPGSEGLFAPRLSRDGRYLAASLRYGQPDQKLVLF